MHATKPIAIGLARQSKTDDRSASLAHQTERVRAAAEANGLRLVDVLQEPDVSGGANLDRRHGLRRAVEMVESGEAQVIVAAYFDRFFRSLKIQAEVLERIERAGGKLLAADTGEVSSGSAGEWLTSTTLGMLAEYHRRITGEKVQDAIRDAVAEGRPPFPSITPAYRRRENGTVELDPVGAPIVAEAFAMRARGASIKAVVAYMRESGLHATVAGVQHMLGSRFVLGELRHGPYVNLTSHDPVISGELFDAVQAVKIPRGRQARSDRLLARLRIVRCATCDGPMGVDHKYTPNGKLYPMYRCSGPNRECTQRAMIAARFVEDAARDEVLRLSADIRGRADTDAELNAAKAAREDAQAALDLAIKSYGAAGLMAEPSSVETLGGLRAARDVAAAHEDRLLAAVAPGVTATTRDDWDGMTPEDRRGLVRALIERIEVRPGRGAGRFTIETRELLA